MAPCTRGEKRPMMMLMMLWRGGQYINPTVLKILHESRGYDFVLLRE